MRVLVRAFAQFREIAGENTCLDLKEGSTIQDLLKAISASHPELEVDLLGSDGTDAVGHGVTILKNRKGVDLSDLSNTALEEGDEVALLPPFSGG